MKKNFSILMALVLLLATAAVGQNHYQFPNPSFKNWTATNSTRAVPRGWHSFNEADGGWAWAVGNHSNAAVDRFGNTNHACQIYSKKVLGINANGAMTIGKMYVGSTSQSSDDNYIRTYRSDADSVGGRWSMAGRPDSVRLWVKFVMASQSVIATCKMHIHGDYDYKDIPSHNAGSAQTGKIANVFCEMVKNQGRASYNGWERFDFKFTYYNASNNVIANPTLSNITQATTSFILASFSTNKQVGGGSENDALYFDDMELIYNKKLSRLTIGSYTLSSNELNTLNNDAYRTASYNNNAKASASGGLSSSAYNVFNTGGTAAYNYTEIVCGNNFPVVEAVTESGLVRSVETSHTATISEPYVTIKVTHNDGSYYTYRINFTNVQAVPATPSITTSSTAVCANESVLCRVNSPVSGITYTWYGGAGHTQLGTGSSQNVTFDIPSGTYNVYCTASNGGCVSEEASTAISLVAVPTGVSAPNAITSNPTSPICGATAVTLQSTVDNNRGARFSWYVGNSTTAAQTSSAAETTTTYNAGTLQPGTHNFSVRTFLTSSGKTCYSNPQTISIVVAALPTVSISHTNRTVCVGANMDPITVTSANGTVTVSGLPAGVALTGNTISGTPTTPGTYNFTVTNNGTSPCDPATATGTIVVSAQPSVTISGQTEICAGESTTLTANAAGCEFAWSNGLGSSAQTSAITAAGTYTVTATNSANCSSTVSQQVTVNALPTVAISGQTEICAGESTTLTANASGCTFAWSNGLGSGAQTSAITAAGTYTVTATNTTTQCSSTASQQVTVNALPTVTISGDVEICQGESTTLAANASGCEFAWSNGLGSSAQTSAITAAGTYTVTATSTTTQCSSTASQQVTVNALPTVTISGDYEICAGESTTLTASAAGCDFAWSNGLGSSAQTSAITAAGTYTVTATSTTTQCSSTASQQVTVNALPTVTISGNHEICQGESTTLTANAAGCEFAWSNGLGSSAQTSAIAAAGTYTVTATHTATQCSSTASQQVTVNPSYQQDEYVSISTAQLPYTWRGHTFAVGTTTNNFVYNEQTANGCDSVVTLHLTVSASMFDLTINYQYENGQTAAPTHTESVAFGANYSVASPVVTGYSPSQRVVSGTMPAENVTVTVTYSANNYTITYKVDGETYTTQTYAYGASVVAPSAPTKEGYEFAAWTPALPATMPAENLEVSAEWNINSYTLTVNYEYADGTEAAAAHIETVEYHANYAVASPSIAGYTPNNREVAGVMPAEDVTVTIVYTANNYTITYKVDGETYTTQTYAYGASVVAPAAPTKEGYTFDGWTPVLPATMPAENLEVSANWNVNDYTITYKVDGEIYTTQTYAYGTSVVAPAAPVKEGYEFAAWTPALPTTMPAENIEVVADWNINSYVLTINYEYTDHTTASAAHTETLNYQASYSVVSPVVAGYVPSQAVVSGTMPAGDVTVTVTYSASARPLTIHYEYADGSQASADYSGNVQVGDTYAVNSPAIEGYTPNPSVVSGTMGETGAEVTVTYSINSYTLTVNYEYADGTEAAAAHIETVEYHANYAVASPSIIGYTPSNREIAGVMPAEDVTVTVVYSAGNYTIIYNVDGETYTTQTYAYGAGVVAPVAPTKEGYTFSGWTPVLPATMPAENLEVSAEWNINSYTLTVNYEYADGTEAAAAHTETVEYHANYAVASPSIAGYTPNNREVAGVMPAEDVTVTIVYTANNYTITYKVDGETYTTQTYAYGASVVAPAAPTKEGYTFSGWTPALPATMPAENLEVSAEWEINRYNLTIHYVYAAGGEAAADYTSRVVYNETYLVESPVIEGYTVSQAVVSGTMGAQDVEQTVTYTIVAPVVEDIASVSAICDGAALNLTDPSVQYAATTGWEMADNADFANAQAYAGQELTLNNHGWYIRFWAANTTGTTYSNAETITVNGLPSVAVSVDGTTASIVRPQADLTYTWSTGATGSSITNLTNGEYSVTATDNRTQCEAVAIFTASDIANSVMITSSHEEVVVCPNETVEVTYTATAVPAGNYEYTWIVDGAVQNTHESQLTYTYSGDRDGLVEVEVRVTGAVDYHITSVFISAVQNTAERYTSCGPIFWRGASRQTTGTYYDSHMVDGCTQVDTLYLTVNVPVHQAYTVNACGSYTWASPEGNGQTYTVSGNYIYEHLNANDCQQVDTLHLTINNPAHQAYRETACGSYTWNGTVYTQSGNYEYAHRDANGCEQVDTLHLTINNPVHQATTVAVCGSYTWNGTVYTQSGNYEYVHRDANGCEQVDTLHLTIHAVPAVPMVTVEDNSSCATPNGSIVVNSPVGDYTYAINEGAFQNSNTFGQLAGGTYTVTVKSAAGCTNSATATVVTLGSSVVAVATANNPCQGDQLTITGEGSSTEGVTYSWKHNGVQVSTDMNYTIPAAQTTDAGTYQLTVTESATGCTAFNAVNVSVHELPVVTIAGDTYFCEGGTTELTVNPSTLASCRWNNGAENRTITIATAGEYSVTGVDAHGCQSHATVVVESRQNPQVTVNRETQICEGETATLSAAGAYRYEWTHPTAWSGVRTGSVMHVSEAGTYTVVGYDQTGCYAAAQAVVVVNALPAVPTFDITDNTSCLSPNGHILVTNPVGGEFVYSMNGGNEQSSDQFSNLDAGTYHIVVRNSQTGCISSADAVVSIVGSTLSATAVGNQSCQGETVELTGSANLAEGVAYAWSGPNGYISREQNPILENVMEENAGTYTLTVTEIATGCTATATADVVIFVPQHSAETIEFCESYTWHGTVYTTSGDYTFRHQDAHGCEQVDTLHLSILRPTHQTLTTAACESYEWNGTVYTESGNYQYRHQDANGCEQVDTLHLTINHPTYSYDDQTACGEFYWRDGNRYTESITGPTITMMNHTGCDSVITLRLTVFPIRNTAETQTACDSYEWHGTVYTISGDYYYEHLNDDDCWQVDTLHLTINQTPVVRVSGNTSITTGSSATLTAVGAESYLWSTGETTSSITVSPAETTTYTVVGTSQNCTADAVEVTVHVNECVPGRFTQVVEECDSYTWRDGITYTESTNEPEFVMSGAASNGCDSIIRLNLTVFKAVHQAVAASACGSYVWNNTTYTTSGDYLFSHSDEHGCWQVDTLHLTIFNPEHQVETASACGSYEWHGTVYTESGNYQYSHQDANGCDQVDTLHLTIFNPQHESFYMESCETYTWFRPDNTEVEYTESGSYTCAHEDLHGCTQVDTLHLTIKHATYSYDDQTSCGEFYWRDGHVYTESITGPSITMTNHAGCDSVITLRLTVFEPHHMAETETACNSFSWYGRTYTQSGDYTYRHYDNNGCELVDTLHLTILRPTHTSLTESACVSYVWNRADGTSQTYTRSGNYVYRHQDANGCTQADTLHLTIYQPTTGVEEIVACDEYTWRDGITYTQSTQTPVFVMMNRNGCDSVVTLHLTIHHPTSSIEEVSACNAYTWRDGVTYTESTNTPTITMMNHNGCDSVITLHLTITAPDHQSYTETACGAYTWAAPQGNGQTYTTSGVYYYTHAATEFCDQVDTLYLTVYHPTHESETVTACEGYTWNGTYYTTSGTYTFAHADVNGCDQVDTLHLTINNAVRTELSATICLGASYTENGFNEHTEGLHTRVLTAANGCDSVVVLNLTINYNCSFTCGDDVYDVDYNGYSTRAYGNLCWMTENLRTTRYSDGTEVPMAAAYHGDMNTDADANVAVFGRLYDWNSASRGATAQPVQGVCPLGWRLPTNDEFRSLADAYSPVGLRSTDYWLMNNGNNNSMFDLRPAGFYNAQSTRFENLGGEAYFYTVDGVDGTQTTHVKALCGCWEFIFGTNRPADGYSVRCVKALD